MKKNILSLAALMALMAAPMMTSCSNDLEEAPVAEPQGNEVTLHIAFPQQEETRVGVNESNKLTGWEANDIVTVYNFNNSNKTLSDGVAFKCVDAGNGTFKGTLPAGKSINDYNAAIYGGTLVLADGENYCDHAFVQPTNRVALALKDVVVLTGSITSGACELSVANSVVKINNTKAAVTTAWYEDATNKYANLMGTYDKYGDHNNGANDGAWAGVEHIEIPAGVSYLSTPDILPGYSLRNEAGDVILEAQYGLWDEGCFFNKTLE